MGDICYGQATVGKTSGKLFFTFRPKMASLEQRTIPGSVLKDKKPARTHARAGELGSTNTDKSTRNRWSGDEAHHEPDTDRLIPTDLAAYTICRAKPIDFMLEDMLSHLWDLQGARLILRR